MSDAGKRWLIISDGGVTIPPLPEDVDVLFMELRAGIAGAWTELRGGREVVLFGYPANSTHRWFQFQADVNAGHSAASLAIERIVHARKRNALAILHGSVKNVAMRGIRVHRSAVTEYTREEREPIADFITRLLD